MAGRTTDTLIDGLCFGEGPRWHDGRLWLSDMHAHEVLAVDGNGRREVVATVPNRPSGLGWLPDGRLLVVSMRDRRLLRREPDGQLALHADLSALASFDCNDMVVDDRGRAWVGNFGFDLHSGAAMTTAELVTVAPDGAARVVARDLGFPNGTVITPDGRTLIVAESFSGRLTAFTIGADGALDDRRTFAELPEGVVPDGICLDAEGAVWLASPPTCNCLRVADGGRVLAEVETGLGAYACMLGGDARKRLYVAVAGSSQPEECREKRDGRIDWIDVAVPGAGWP